ncbi:MAG: hypothetical protein ABJJ37_11715 [Roseibium sp.]
MLLAAPRGLSFFILAATFLFSKIIRLIAKDLNGLQQLILLTLLAEQSTHIHQNAFQKGRKFQNQEYFGVCGTGFVKFMKTTAARKQFLPIDSPLKEALPLKKVTVH